MSSVNAELADISLYMAQELDAILHEERLEMVFQPIRYLTGGALVGYEALARFQHPTLTRPPNEWFDAAARTGRRCELELHAIELALAVLPHLPPDAFMSVNASPSTIFAPELQALLAPQNLDAIVLEVTEQEPIDSYDEFAAAIEPLRRAGMRLAVDDVGAGVASLTHLLNIDPDILKLDRALITRIASSRKTRALAAALTSFAIEAGAQLVAEGIETETDRALLEALGIGLGQGFLLGRPGALPI